MDAIMSIAKEHDLKVVEDVAHQHGSRWRDKGAGAIGDAGSFSFQQSKVLTSGEGGAVTCNDDAVHRLVFALKQVGWAPDPSVPYVQGQLPKLVGGNHYGHNYRITEMQAVLLRGGLSRLAEQTRRREEAAQYLADGLKRMGGPLRVARRDPRVTRQAYYCMTFVFDPAQAGGLTRVQYAQAIGAEGCPLGGPYAPVYRSPLMNLYDGTSPVPYRDASKIQNYGALKLPNTERACNETALVMSHTHMLGDRAYLDQILAGIEKVNDNIPAVKAHFAAQVK
jgi:dTDP-4-amino-4,6-dideoxygalactose transaminase